MEDHTIQTVSVSKLSIKEQAPRVKGVTKAIRAKLSQIPENSAIAMQDLATYVLEAFPQSIPDKQQAYVRINHALKTLKGKFQRYENKDNKRIYIGRAQTQVST